MPDQSALDLRYFIDDKIYNCPFCNRRHVTYYLTDHLSFDWTDTKTCYVYIAKCASCTKESMHLSFEDIETYEIGREQYRFTHESGKKLDDKFFYSVPTSFFSLDESIPRILRKLLTEAEGCLKSNYLTGASACIRKGIYELAVLEKAVGDTYEDRIKSLKALRQDVETDYFDTLLTIQKITSDKVHEESYDGWNTKHLRLILATIKEILNAMYVVPELRKKKRQAIIDLKKEVLGREVLGGIQQKNTDKQKK